MEKFPIYTVGYGNRSIETFVALLKKYQIKYLVDVRSQPYSQYNQQFSKDLLEKYLGQHGIRYMFMGDTLGGRPKDESCYDEKRRVDYAKLSSKSFYQEGIDRLRTAWKKNLLVAIMCSEVKPSECHRGKLIGNTLNEQGITVAHIDEKENIKQQQEVNRLIVGMQQLSLLDESLPEQNEKIGFSRKTYLTRTKQEDIHAT
ncbi:MAG: DUF488 domain-containing protein [Ktedonobacteraceae bacterium]